MSELFLAQAQILVTPDTSGFRAQLLVDLEKAQKNVVVRVGVLPDMKGFREALQKGVAKSSTGVIARVLVRPDLTGFRAALQAAVTKAAAGVTVPITPVAGKTAAAATGAAAVTTGGVVDRRLAEAQKAVNAAVDAGVASRRRITEALSIEEKRAARLIREELSLRAAQDAVKKAVLSGNPALVQQAENLERVARAAVEATAAQQARVTERQARPAVAAAEQAAAEKAAAADLTAARKVTARQFEQIEKERAATVGAASKAAETFYKNEAATARATSIEATRAASAQTKAFRQTEIEAEKQAAVIQKAADKEIAARQAAAAAARQAQAQIAGLATFTPTFSAAQSTQSVAATGRIAAAQAAVNRARAELAHVTVVVATAEAAFNKALATTDRALQSNTAELLITARAEEVLRTQTLKTAAAEQAAAKQEARLAAARTAQAASAGRAVFAQSAQLVGLRGAALSANASFIAAAAGVIGFAKAISSFAKFQQTLNVFAATADATAVQMGKVRAESERLGRDITLPGVGAQDAAEAMTELSKAGLSVRDSLDGARGVLQLATAAAIDNAQATELAASALNAFGLSGDQAVHVADVLANAANDAQGSIVDIGTALQQASAVGRQAGLSLEETSAVLTLFARNGLRGSDAGTSLRTALIRLINPTKKAQEQIDKLGLRLRTSTGAINLDVFSQFARVTRSFTAAQRDQALAIIFGQDAIRGAAILAREGKGALDAQIVSLNQSGTAAKLAAARMSGLSGDVENLKNQLSDLGLTIGGLVEGPLSVLVKGFTNFTKSTNTALHNLVFGIKSVFGGDVFNEADKNFDQLAKKIDDLQGRRGFLKAGIFGGQDAEDLRESIARLGEEASKIVQEGFLNRVIAEFIHLSPQVRAAMEDNVITPAEQAQLQADGLGRAFLEAIPHTADLFQSFGVLAKSSIEDAGAQVRRATPEITAAIRSSIEDAGAQAKAAAAAAGANLGDSIVQGLTAALNIAKSRINSALGSVGRQARLSLGRLQSQFLDLQLRGASPQERLANVQARERQQQRLVELGETRGIPRAELNKRKQTLIDLQNEEQGIRDEITANAEKAAADAKQKADDIKQARDDADQAILDAFTGRRDRLDVSATRAAESDTLKDDLAVQVALANTISREIGIIENMVKDQKTRRDQIASRVKELAQVGVQIDSLRKQITQQVKDAAQKARDAVTEAVGKRLQLAQIVGNKDAILQAFDRAIADARRRVNRAKKLKKGLLDEQIALAQLVKDRKEFLEDLDKESDKGPGTTAFDLLQQFSDRFNEISGNLINTNQPFAGPTGFTADIAQFLKRQQGAPTTITTGGKSRVELSNDLLIRAINRLIAATDANTDAKGGNASAGETITGTPLPKGTPWSDVRFYKAAQARAAAEAGG